MRVARIALAVLGIAAIVYGAQMFINAPTPTVIGVGIWLVAAVIINDGVLSPLVLAISALVRRVPARGRRYLQFGLIMAAAVTVIAIPMIIKQGTFPPVKALLRQHYQLNLAILLGLIAVGVLVAYAVTVARRGRPDSRPDTTDAAGSDQATS